MLWLIYHLLIYTDTSSQPIGKTVWDLFLDPRSFVVNKAIYDKIPT